jgi:hypothetical protein
MNLCQAKDEFPTHTVIKPSQLFKGLKRGAKITPEMLVGEDIRVTHARLDGQRNSDNTTQPVIVVYDRDYALGKLGVELGLVLRDTPLDQWLEFATELWEMKNKANN